MPLTLVMSPQLLEYMFISFALTYIELWYLQLTALYGEPAGPDDPDGGLRNFLRSLFSFKNTKEW